MAFNVLHISHRVPYPATDGGAIAIGNMIQGLSKNGCVIDLICINTPKSINTDGKITGVRQQFDVFVNTKIVPLKALSSLLFRQTPYNVERFWNKEMSDLIDQLLTENKYDFILLESAFTCIYLEQIKALTEIPIIVRTHNFEAQIWERLSVNESNPFKAWYKRHLAKRLRNFEKKVYNLADGIASITAEDGANFQKMGVSTPLSIVPAAVDLDQYKTLDDVVEIPQTIYSISSLDWAPNIEGLKWFLNEIWPHLHEKLPSLEFHIAGKSMPTSIKELNLPNVVIHGFADNANEFHQAHQIMIVPLLSGSGMRVKIIEGFANKKCIISSAVGAEGINYIDRENILIANTKHEWIDAILFAVENSNQRNLIAENAYKFVQQTYNNTEITKELVNLYLQVKK